jgi:phage terminase large subunit-like protein
MEALQRKVKDKKLKRSLEASQIAFTRFFFKARGEVFIPGDHHRQIDEALVKLERGELLDKDGKPTNNLLITLPPRFGKTQISVIDWMARSIAKNARAKFIHLSYSDELALDNSAKCRETVLSQAYQDFWPVRLKSDADSKKKWYTEQGGGVYATAAGGAVTGFGAGSLADISEELRAQLTEEDLALECEMDEFFSDTTSEPLDPNLFYGAIIIDDPIKVTDADNENARNLVNKRLNNTIKSRRNSRNTPIVIIMQRLHEDDMAGFVLGGGMEETFHHLNLKSCDEVTKTSLWPAKHTFDELMKIKLADHAVFMAQYQQDPTPDEGSFFKAEYFQGKRFRLGQEPTKIVKYGAGDYAVTEDAGDWTEQAIAGFDLKENLYFFDWHSAQTTIDKSIDTMMQMILDHDPMIWAGETGVIRRAMEPYIKKEQQRRRNFIKFEWLPATKSKAVNAKAFQGLCAAGKVYIPYGGWGDDLIAQLLKFTGKDDKVDDKVDVCGIFGRLLGSTLGPGTYHDQLDKPDNDYGIDEDDDEYGNGTIPV